MTGFIVRPQLGDTEPVDVYSPWAMDECYELTDAPIAPVVGLDPLPAVHLRQ
jgi:hypothetical protein